MADLRQEAEGAPETQPNSPKPSPSVLEPRERLGCDHVQEGAPIAGFVSVELNGRMTDGTVISLRGGPVLLDVCAECLALARSGEIHYNHDRRHADRPRPSSSVVEHSADNREVAAKTTTERPIHSGHGDAAEASGSTPAMGSNPSHTIQPWDEHRLSDRERWAYGSGPRTLAGDDDL